MRENKRLSLRQLLLSSALLFLFSLFICLPQLARRDQIRFTRFSAALYEQEMTGNTLSLHYSLAHPEAYGITHYPITLPLYQPGSEETTGAHLEYLSSQLQAINRSHLKNEDAYACDCLADSLSLSRKMADFPYYAEPFSPVSGIQCQLPILFCEYEFREKKDIEEYLILLGQTGAFFDSLLLYENERADRGLLMSAASLQKVLEQCDTIVTSDALAGDSHFLQTSFAERLQSLAHTASLSREECAAYSAQNDALLEQIFLPAYQALKKGLSALMPKASAKTCGLEASPNGKEYYRLLLAKETGSAKTPEKIRALLERTLSQETETIQLLVKAYPGCLSSLQSGSYLEIGTNDANVILQDLKLHTQMDFPASSIPDATLKKVSQNLQDFSAPAFYLTAPIDKTDKNVIYLNEKDLSNSLELYTTLAHEGYPGHLFQNACMATQFSTLSDSRIRQLLGCGGYLEGWALYVEQKSYDYCSRFLVRQDRPADAVCVQLEKHNRSRLLCLYSLLDLMIHYDGATPEDIQTYLAPFGIRDADAVSALYAYVCESPCNYPKYYVGYMEILELRQLAMKEWGEHYSDREFHAFLLKWGPADFRNLREMLLQQSFL